MEPPMYGPEDEAWAKQRRSEEQDQIAIRELIQYQRETLKDANLDPKQHHFLLEYAMCGDYVAAAKRCGIGRATVLLWKRKHPRFAEAMDSLQSDLLMYVERLLFRAARKESSVAMFLAKGLAPEKYNRRPDDGPVGDPVRHEIVGLWLAGTPSDEEMAALPPPHRNSAEPAAGTSDGQD